MRIARLGVDGIHLEKAGEGEHPSALCYRINMTYFKLQHSNGVVVFKEGLDVSLMKVALIRRLPSGDGISITSHVDGLNAQFGDIISIMLSC